MRVKLMQQEVRKQEQSNTKVLVELSNKMWWLLTPGAAGRNGRVVMGCGLDHVCSRWRGRRLEKTHIAPQQHSARGARCQLGPPRGWRACQPASGVLGHAAGAWAPAAPQLVRPVPVLIPSSSSMPLFAMASSSSSPRKASCAEDEAGRTEEVD